MLSLIIQHVNFLMHRVYFFLACYKILALKILTHLEYYNPCRLASEHVHTSYTSKAVDVFGAQSLCCQSNASSCDRTDSFIFRRCQ